MKVKEAYWFTGLDFVIGIVVGEDEGTGRRKGYIGTAAGFDEKRDTQHIAGFGSPVDPSKLTEIANYLTGTATS